MEKFFEPKARGENKQKSKQQHFDKQSRIKMAKEYLTELFAKVKERKFGYLWTKQDKATYPFDVSDTDALAAMAQKAIELNDAGFDVYYSVNLTDAPPAKFERVKSEKVTMQVATVADIDTEGGNHASSEEKKYPPDFETAKSFLPFAVSSLVNSGYGLHALCIYDEPIVITDLNREQAKKRNKDFINVIRIRAGEFKGAVDGVGDLPRVLRVPGTFNQKLKDNPPLCHVVEGSDTRFTPDDFDALQGTTKALDAGNSAKVQSARKFSPNGLSFGTSDSSSPRASRQERADFMEELMTTREVADRLEVSPKTVVNWRSRKLFGCYFFAADEKKGGVWYYKRERVEQLKSVYQFGILQNMYKLARRNPEPTPPDFFQIGDSSRVQDNGEEEELSFRHREFFTVEEVADYYDVSINTVKSWVKRGQLKEDMLGHNGDLYFAIDNILDFIPPSTKSEPAKKSTAYHIDDDTDYKEFRIQHMLPCISVAKGDYEKWLGVGFALFNEGFECSYWAQWSKTQPEYKEGECESKWAGFKSDPNGYTIRSLYQWATAGGYNERDTKREWFQLHPELKPSRGKDIASDMQRDLDEAIIWLESLTPADMTADVARSGIHSVALADFFGFAAAAAKFFECVTEAKETAAKLLAESKKNTDKKLSSAEETKLKALVTGVRLSDLRKHVDSEKSAIRKAHKDFIRHAEAKAVQERRDAYKREREGETTQKQIADCPIDLKIPFECQFNSNGVSIVDYSGKFPKTILAANSPMIPTKVFREPNKHTTQYEVAIQTRHIWRRVIVEGKNLLDPRRVLELNGEGGALICDGKALCKFFAAILKANEDTIPEIKCFAQPGWENEDFQSFVYPTHGDYIVRRAGFEFDKEFATRGNADVWKIEFLCAQDLGGAVARIFLGGALAAPLARPLCIMNPQIHISGNTNLGKSALLKLGASVYGNPKKLIRTFAATQKNLQAVAAACRDLPVFVDELGTADKKTTENLAAGIYEFAEGKSNQAQKRDGSMREPLEFSGARLTAGEFPILKNRDARGAYKRVVQINADKLFDRETALGLHLNIPQHYGHWGRRWAEFVTENLQEIISTFQRMRALEEKIAVEDTQRDIVVAAAIALQYFLVCIGHREKFDAAAAAEDIKEICRMLPRPDDLNDTTRALADLASVVASKENFFVKEGAPTNETTPDGDSVIGEVAPLNREICGKIFKSGEVAILPTVLRQWLERDLGFASADALVTAWAKEGKIRSGGKKGYRFNTRINGSVKTTYRFVAGTLWSNESEEEEV